MSRPCRILSAALVGAAVAFAPFRADAVVDTEAFAPLVAELEHRRDNDFTAPLTRLAKKQKAAVLKGLQRIARPADDIADDAATALLCISALQPVYGDDFLVPAKIADLRGIFDTLGADIEGGVRAAHAALAARADGLPAASRRKVQAKLDAAQRAFDQISAGGLVARQRFSRLASAAKAVVAGSRIADKATPTGGGLRATVDGGAWASSFAQSEYSTGDQALQVFGRRTRGDGTQETIFLVVRGVSGPGTYPLTAADAQGSFQELTSSFQYTQWDLVPDSGTLTVQTLSVGATKRVKATFSFSASHATKGTRTIAAGTHDVTEVDVKSGNGF